ncbi:MAG: hypothetical protein IKE20_01155 [Eggerthellaceae bacterium]|nr:hypothetical protein [Eggerthellaceae bacterium]
MKTIAKLVACACAFALALVLAGCSSGGSASSSAASASASASAASASASAASASAAAASTLEDGTYEAVFSTDSSMFHVNEADEGKGVLTVENGKMTIHVRLASKKIVNVYAGLAKDAETDAANVIQPTTDTVTYSDGDTKEVYGFDIPVPALDEEFDVAILGEKGTWYDHKVSVSNPVAIEKSE